MALRAKHKAVQAAVTKHFTEASLGQILLFLSDPSTTNGYHTLFAHSTILLTLFPYRPLFKCSE